MKESPALIIPVFFFLHFVELLQLLFFFEGFLGLFLDIFTDQKAFLLFRLVTPLGLHVLVYEHFVLLRSVSLFAISKFLLSLFQLFVQVHSECLLKLPLLNVLVLLDPLLDLVLVAQDGTPFIENLFLALNRQMSPFLYCSSDPTDHILPNV